MSDIAARAGVSKATVSNAITGKKPVSPETRARIQAAIDELGFVPSAAARALAHGRADVVGLVVPRHGAHLSASHLAFVGAIAEAAVDNDQDLLLLPATAEREQRDLERLAREGRVDGVLLMEVALNDYRVELLRRIDFPFVVIGRTEPPGQADWVDMDYDDGVRRCVGHLADLGHKRIALINRPAALLTGGYGPAQRALRAFEAAVTDCGVVGRTETCEDTPDSAHSLVSMLLQLNRPPTALVTVNEAAVAGIFAAVSDAGLQVPDDISVTGVTVSGLSTTVVPALTAVDVPVQEMSERAVQTLLHRLEAPDDEPKGTLVNPPLTVRRSTGRPRR